jgi:hypothetical protein
MGINGWKDTQQLPMQPAGEVQRMRLQPPQQLQQAGKEHSDLTSSSSTADGCDMQQQQQPQDIDPRLQATLKQPVVRSDTPSSSIAPPG